MIHFSIATVLILPKHIAFTYDSVYDLLKAYHQRKALGFEPLWCVNHGPTLSMCMFHVPLLKI
jgi:hypothetical protein